MATHTKKYFSQANVSWEKILSISMMHFDISNLVLSF